MKFKGYGQVWDNEKNKVLVDFESGINQPGIVEVNDPRIHAKLIEMGYKPIILEENKVETPKATKIEKTEEVKDDSNTDGNQSTIGDNSVN